MLSGTQGGKERGVKSKHLFEQPLVSSQKTFVPANPLTVSVNARRIRVNPVAAIPGIRLYPFVDIAERKRCGSKSRRCRLFERKELTSYDERFFARYFARGSHNAKRINEFPLDELIVLIKQERSVIIN
jgi:hypothetical protein